MEFKNWELNSSWKSHAERGVLTRRRISVNVVCVGFEFETSLKWSPILRTSFRLESLRRNIPVWFCYKGMQSIPIKFPDKPFHSVDFRKHCLIRFVSTRFVKLRLCLNFNLKNFLIEIIWTIWENKMCENFEKCSY